MIHIPEDEDPLEAPLHVRCPVCGAGLFQDCRSTEDRPLAYGFHEDRGMAIAVEAVLVEAWVLTLPDADD